MPAGYVVSPLPDKRFRIIIFAWVALISIVLFAQAMSAGLNHDEQQFVSGGQLLASHGLLPYRDFPYFHMPILAMLDAMLFAHTHHLLLVARASSVLCAGLSLAAIVGMAYVAQGAGQANRKLLTAMIVGSLLFANPIFISSYFRTWNQALPLLLTLLTIACHWRGAIVGQSRWFGFSGILVALAFGTRLTFAPLALPFLVMTWLTPGSGRSRLAHAASFCAGLIFGAIPSLLFIAKDPVAFLFDNFVYNGPVNIAFRGPQAAFWPGLWGKTIFLLHLVIQPANFTLLAAFAALNLFTSPRGNNLYLRRVVWLLLPFAFLGALAATPSYPQYYYPVVALLVAGILPALADDPGNVLDFRRRQIFLLVALGAGSITAAWECRRCVVTLLQPSEWVATQIHREAADLKALVPKGAILTFAPVTPLEAGLDIYPAFATGPFAWRTARFLTPWQRARFGFVGRDDLENLLAAHPPSGILTGYDQKKEISFTEYAMKHGYTKINLRRNRTLWLPPHP